MVSQEVPTQEVVLRLICNVTKQPLKDVHTVASIWDGQARRVVAESSTDEQGEVRFNLPYGTYYVDFNIDSPLYYNTWTWFTVPVPEDKMPIIVEAERIAEEVKVKVIYSEIDPRPVREAVVTAYKVIREGDRFYLYPSEDIKRTNEQGEAVLILRRNQYYLITSNIGDDQAIIYVPDQTSVTLTYYEKVSVRVEEVGTRLPIPGAKVTIRNLRFTSEVFDGTTDESGRTVFYLERNIPYEMTIEASGYKAYRSEIRIIKNLIFGEVKNSFVVELEKEPSQPPPIQPPPEQPPVEPPTQPPQQPTIDKKLLLLGLGALAAVVLLSLMTKKDED